MAASACYWLELTLDQSWSAPIPKHPNREMNCLRSCFACLCALLCLSTCLSECLPSVVSEGLELFHEEVRRYFSDCVAIDASDSGWLQVQLSLSRGGLGLCRLALHGSAAYLASIIQTGCSNSFDEFRDNICWILLGIMP